MATDITVGLEYKNGCAGGPNILSFLGHMLRKYLVEKIFNKPMLFANPLLLGMPVV